MQISALEVWHVNNEENNSQMCSFESGSADENIETMKAYMCKQRGMHLGSKISREEITKKVNQSKYEKYCYITNRLRREQFPLGLFKYSVNVKSSALNFNRKRQTMRLTLNETPLFYERRGFLHSSGSSDDQGIRSSNSAGSIFPCLSQRFGSSVRIYLK